MKTKKILVTGGLGFIGSHTVVELIGAGYEPVIIDNLSNSAFFILERIEKITSKKVCFVQLDVCDKAALKNLFAEQKNIQLVIHFAAYKAVAESVKFPLKYFSNNLISLLNLLEVMEESSCRNIVFSSSATVYGDPDSVPVPETTAFKKALSAYGSTKQMAEEILEKVTATGIYKSIALRYFNPAGAHSSGLIGELPNGIPNNLMPFITQAANGQLKELTVFGNEYDTPDGTCVRDYIHVEDLAKAHVKACERLLANRSVENFESFNIGTGNGLSVLQVIKTFEKINSLKIPYRIGSKREGDAAQNYADVSKANKILNWKAELDIEDMVRDAWNWQNQVSLENKPGH